MAKQQIRPFTEVLEDLAEHRLIEELTTQWLAVVNAARETNKPASLTLTLTAATSNLNTVAIAAEVSTKMPGTSLGATVLYSDDAGNVTKHDPRQLSLKVTPIKGGAS